MEFDLNDLKRLLPCPIPAEYVEYVAASKPADLKKRGFDPKTLCVLNLRLRERDRKGWTKDRFFLTGDGSGNYYFISTKESKANRVQLWAHDPPGIEDQKADLKSFLNSATQEDPIITTVDPETFCIARTDIVGESILQPITLPEWKEALASCEGVEYRGYRSGKNPFTGKELRMDVPGLAVATIDQEELHLQLYSGRIKGDDLPAIRPVAEKLARVLKARLIVSAG